ncbi:MAG TPA: deoxyribonuclease IV [Gemmatimonadales bacterium]|nr:deoxyribonuclease IV [Gemmatimonadales bacterium]
MPPSRRPATQLLGAHVSTQGGVHNAPGRGVEIGATAIQVFTKTPNQWRDPEVSPAGAESFRKSWVDSGIAVVVSHDSYLINLASPDPVLNRRSVESFTAELTRCHLLGIPAVVSHPGNYIDDRAEGLRRNAEGLAAALTAAPGTVRVLLETTAGTGTALGSRFEELAELRGLLPDALRGRVGFCADTCHLYSAGLDLLGDYDGVWAQFDAILGLEHLGCLHLNDSKTPFASRRDRHELIGEGSLGPAPFRRLVQDPRFRGTPMILETPKGDDGVTNDKTALRKLRSWRK